MHSMFRTLWINPSAPIVCLFALLSSAPFFWPDVGAGNFQYIGGADYLSPINILNKLQYAAFPFNHFNLAGVDQAFLIATIPLYLFYYLFRFIGLSPLIITLLFISFLIFIAQISFYAYLKYVTQHKLYLKKANPFLLVFGSIAYGFSPYVIAMIIPGHMMTIIIYAFFPLIIKYLDVLITSKKINYGAILSLFLIFTACAPGFANIGIIYVLLVACLIYVLSLLFVGANNLIPIAERFSLFVALVLLANTWWLLPHLANIEHVIAINQSSAPGITAAANYASKHATLTNIFLGRAESLLYMKDIVGNAYYVVGAILWVFLSILSFFLASLFFRKKYVYSLLLAMLISILFLKGPQHPFPDLFMWAYENVPGFKIFRRPVAKFYGFFLFFYLAIATIGYVFITRKYAGTGWRALFLFLAGLAATGYLVIIFSVTGGLSPFNIPDMYSRANAFLLKDQVTRLLILPSTYGLNPMYSTSVNSYTGQDFINEVFTFPKISPDSTHNSNDELYKLPTNDLMALIREDKSICEAARRLGVSHIMVRQDLNPIQAIEDKPTRLISALNSHLDINYKINFGGKAGLNVYKIKDKCIGGLISAQGVSSLKYSVLNPGKIILKFERLQKHASLDFLVNFNDNWKIYPSKVEQLDCGRATFNVLPSPLTLEEHCGGFASFFTDVRYLIRSPVFDDRHTISNEFANRWEIGLDRIQQEISADYYHLNSDGSVDLSLVLYYQSQAYVAVGLMISLLTLGVFLVLRFYQKARLRIEATLPGIYSPQEMGN